MRQNSVTKEETKANERFAKLLLRLNSKKESVRIAAEIELREQWPDGMQRLLKNYQTTTNLWKNRGKWGTYSALAFFVVSVIVHYAMRRGLNLGFLIHVALWPIGLLTAFSLNAPSQRNNRIRYLLNFDDVKIVGPLVDALAFRDEVTQQEARQALVRLLPRLQASDANLLNGEQREQLRQMLFTDYKELGVSILKAYEHIGDGAELEAVERLLQNAIWDVEVRDAAEACLPFLQLRAQQMQSSQTLLRASQHATTPDILLRPAGNAQTQDETQLLRMSGK